MDSTSKKFGRSFKKGDETFNQSVSRLSHTRVTKFEKDYGNSSDTVTDPNTKNLSLGDNTVSQNTHNENLLFLQKDERITYLKKHSRVREGKNFDSLKSVSA